MKLFDVYSLWNIEPVEAKGCRVWDKEGTEYLDLYGGHAVISIGHSHPKYVKSICEQASKIAFYSNSVLNSLQEELAKKLGEISGYTDYSLFLCNSGAEAIENALKLASFKTGRRRVIAFKEAFHGRSSGAVAVTDNPNIQSPFNKGHEVVLLKLNDTDAVQEEAGIFQPTDNFLKQLETLCKIHNVPLIIDEIQSGYGRTGKFFAHQYAGIKPDIITTAKGMGNGFPIGGVLISPKFEAKKGMLGTTFGGNHLACAAAIAVLNVIEEESLVNNANMMGQYLQLELKKIKSIKAIRGRGLMLGIELQPEHADVRNRSLFESHIFTGAAKNGVIRLLPPLTITKEDIDMFLSELRKKTVLNSNIL